MPEAGRGAPNACGSGKRGGRGAARRAHTSPKLQTPSGRARAAPAAARADGLSPQFVCKPLPSSLVGKSYEEIRR